MTRSWSVAFASPAPESIATTFAPRGPGRSRRSRTYARDLSAPHNGDVDVVALAEPQEVDQRPAIRVDRARRPAKISLHRQPASPQRTRGERRPALHEPSLRGDILTLMAIELPVIHSAPAPQRAPENDPERDRLVARARLLARAGLVWHGIEAAVAIAAGAVAGSIALIAFGADSLIEALAGIIVLWRFTSTRADSETAERRAQQLIAITFWLLAAYVTVDATIALASGEHPASSPVGIALSIVTLIAMPLLARAKASVARQLGSHAGHSESRQNLLCAYLSAALLIGLTLNAALGWWWADPAHRSRHRRGRRARRTRELARRELLHRRRLLRLTRPPGPVSGGQRANAQRSSPPARRSARWRPPQKRGPSKPPR